MKYKDGMILIIPIQKVGYLYGQIIRLRLVVYDYISNTKRQDIYKIKEAPILFSCNILQQDIIGNKLELLGHSEISEKELDQLPKQFWQDPYNLNSCTITDVRGVTEEAPPADCKDLERTMAWPVDNIITRIENHLNNEPNFYLEYYKLKTPHLSH